MNAATLTNKPGVRERICERTRSARNFFDRLIPMAEPMRLCFGARIFKPVDLLKARVVVWDLDGTLYPRFNLRAIKIFAGNVGEFVDARKRKEFDVEVEKIFSGNSSFPVGKYYDPVKRKSLRFGFFGSPEKFFVPDRMWQVAAAADFFGVSRASICRAYVGLKDFMSSRPREFGMQANEKLAALLEKLGDKQIIVATNSPRRDAERILANLGVASLVDAIYSSARKPEKARVLFEYLAVKHGVASSELLSIGDSWVSDIREPRKLGAATILISNKENAGKADVVAESLDAVIHYLSLEWGALHAH